MQRDSGFTLLTASDVSLAWEIVRRDVVRKLTGREAQPVPSLAEAHHYDLWEVLAKERQSWRQRMRHNIPTLYDVGPLYQLLAPPGISEQMDPCDVTEYEDTLDISQDFHYEISREKSHETKTIHVQVKGCRRIYSNFGIYQHLLRLNQDVPLIKQAKEVYVITEVYRADCLLITISLNEKEKHWLLKGPVPVAFIMHRHPLGPRADLLPSKLPSTKRKRCCNCWWFTRYRHPQDTMDLPLHYFSTALKARLKSALKRDVRYSKTTMCHDSISDDQSPAQLELLASLDESNEMVINTEDINVEMDPKDHPSSSNDSSFSDRGDVI